MTDKTVFTTLSIADLAALGDLETLAPATPPQPDGLSGLPIRYEPGLLLGVGGTGKVYRAYDKVLQRPVALKILRADRRQIEARFLEEARGTAKLIHPAIVPVYDAGLLEDRRPWFTMREVDGQQLAEVIASVHHISGPEHWESSADGWSFTRLIRAFLTVCEAVGYAHDQGVIHRDLKPHNILVGRYGEVLVVDWGLARLESILQSDDSVGLSSRTHIGAVIGTPAYMPPEQARGAVVDQRADVWSLGAILYEICGGHPPYGSHSLDGLLEMARGGQVPRLTAPRIPEEIADICASLLQFNPEDRPQNGAAVAEMVGHYLEGARRRERALELVTEAQAKLIEADIVAQTVLKEERAARAALSGIARWESAERKLAGWEHEAAAATAQAEQLRLVEEAEGLFEAALTHDPNLSEAHVALVRSLRHQHRDATGLTAGRIERQMRQHLSALPSNHPEVMNTTRYLRGHGFLSLITEPPAEALLYQYTPQHRRLTEVFVANLGQTPLRQVELPEGSYLIRLRREGYEEVRYPVEIRRLEHWDGIAPGDREPTPIQIPHHLDPSEVYVPAGWARFGGPPSIVPSLPPHRAWVDAFCIQRFPVRNDTYLTFLDRLIAEGREDLLQRAQPHHHSGPDANSPIYGLNSDGKHFLRPDGEGQLWLPEWPVVMISHAAASIFASWQTGWRLPSEHEREKASRGVDGRIFPWGDGFDPSFCWMRESHRDQPILGAVDGTPRDISPYGLRGSAGNVIEWTQDPYTENVPSGRPVVADTPDARFWVAKGAGWLYREAGCATYARGQIGAWIRRADLGVRLVRPFRP